MSQLSINRVLLSGSAWTAIGEALSGAAIITTTVIAMRVLELREFGIYGMAMLALNVLRHFSQTGFETALIQKSDDIGPYMDVAWTWLLLRGVAVTLLLSASAPMLVYVYDEPRLFWICIACASSALVSGLNNIGHLFYTRDLNFRTLFLIKAAQTLMQVLIFIPAIFYFQNVWALVISHLGSTTANCIISYIAHPYRPKLAWDKAKLKELIHFGKWLTGMAFILYIATQGDDLFVSKFFGLAALGVYQKAYEVSNTPATKITHVIGRIGMATYSRLQHDPEALRTAFTRVMRVTLLISGPVSILIFLAAPDIPRHIIGERWEPAVPLIRILVLAGLVRSFAALAGPLFQATGRPDYDFKMNTPRFLAVVLLIWPASHYWGIEGACWVVVIAISTCLPTWFYGVKRQAGVGPLDVMKSNLLAVFSTALFGASYFGVRSQLPNDWLSALLGLVGGIALWMIALAVLGKFTRFDIYGEVRRLFESRKAPNR